MRVILRQYIRYLDIDIGSIGLPESVMEVLTVKKTDIVAAFLTPDTLMGALIRVTLKEVIGELGASLLCLRVTRQVIVLKEASHVYRQPLLLVAFP